MTVTLSNAKTTLADMYLKLMFPSNNNSVTPNFNFIPTPARDYATNPYIPGENTSTNSNTSTTTNHNPVGTATGFTHGEEDNSYRFTSTSLLDGFSDPDGNTLSVYLLTATNGKITANADSSWTLIPNMNFNGSLELNYIVSDNKGGTIKALTNFILNPVNDIPTGKSTFSFASGIENFTKFTLKDADLLQGFSDPDGDILQTANIKVTNAIITKFDNATWIVQPDYNFSGVIDFTYDVIDNNGGVITAKNSFIINDNNGNDLLIGTEVKDVLDGGLGKDTLIGKSGDDIYFIDNSGDKVIEYLDDGYDTVNSLINYTLGKNLEDLELLGDDTLKGAGNELDNSIIGNNGNNALKGMLGNDTLIGGLGSDTLTGGKGSDTFEFSPLDFWTVDSNGSYMLNKFIDTITDFNPKEGDTMIFDDGELEFYNNLSEAKTAGSYLFYIKGSGKIYLDSDTTGLNYTPVVIIKLTGNPKVNIDLTDWDYPTS